MCLFCLESSNPQAASFFLGEDWPYPDRVIAANEDMYAVPGFGPQVFPYVLLISRRHFSCLSDATPRERRSLFRILQGLRASSLFVGGSMCVFEHGGCKNRTQSCIDHFHLHIVDGTLDLRSYLEAEYVCEDVAVTSEAAFVASTRYLFAGFYDRSHEIKGILARSPEPESQYFRRKIATVTGQAQWDWRAGMNRHLMLKVMERAPNTAGDRTLATTPRPR